MTDFDDGKEDGALRTIGEVSEALGIKPHVLRYWEQQFKMLKPLKRSGSRRYYRPEDVDLVERIDRLVNQEGYTIKGAQQVLRSSGASEFDRRQSDRRQGDRRTVPQHGRRADDDPSATLPVAKNLGDAIGRLKSIRSRLAAAIEA
ncbi:MAG: MerR family transcriptional regulator [Pseudomonadota bacterium]